MSGGAGGWRWFVPVALVGIGLLFVTTARLSSGDDVRSQRNGDLTGLIEAEQTRLGDLTDRVQSLRDQVDQLSAPADDRGLRQLQRASGRANAAAGITATSGPALEVTLTDAAVPADGIPDGFVPDDYVVHQQDLQGVINALWAGGAEALQVQDQRIISTSAVRCVGNTLILQGRVYSPPYRVKAIGPTDRMRRALDLAPSVDLYRQYVDLIGLGYDVEVLSSATVGGYRGPLQLRYAKAAT